MGEISEQLPLYETTKKILLMHNTVDDPVQRPRENVGGVYSRQAIEAGQVLKGEIRFKTSIGKDLDFSEVGGFVRLGTSKKDDYGLACFEILAEPITTMPELKDNKLVAYLASDVLLRNDNLRQTNLVADLKAELEKSLGTGTLKSLDDVVKPLEDELPKIPEIEKSKRDEIKNKIEEIKEKFTSLIQVRRIESWHEGWGFPRPTFTAMAAGSVAVFEVGGEIKPQDLQTLELSGIGERRGEGYGQIKFNPKILTEKINSWKVPSRTEKPTADESQRGEAIEKLKSQIKAAENFKQFIENIELSAWREEIARAVLKIADNPLRRREMFGFGYKGKESVPPLSQIGGLRSTIGKVKFDGSNKNVVTVWLNHLQETSNRKDKWENNFGKIEELFINNSEIWNCFEVKDDAGNPICFNKPQLIVFEENALKEKLWAKAVKSLFDACARAHKRKTEDNKDGEED